MMPESSNPKKQSYLDVPPTRPSRLSLDSTYSELSELSFHSNELESHHPLIRSLSRSRSRDDAYYTHPTSQARPRSRLQAALHSFWITNYGALLVLLSQLFGSLMNLFTRLLETPGPHGAPMHPFQILFVRQSITATLCTGWALYSKSIPDFPFGARPIRSLLVARGLSGFFGVFGMYFSLLYLPLSEATVLTFLAPILTCYLCSFVIPGETFTRQQQLAGVLSLVGVIFIAHPTSLFTSSSSSSSSQPQPPPPSTGLPDGSPSTTDPQQSPTHPTSHQHLIAIGIAMLGVVGSTGAMTSIRAIGTRAHPFLSINYFSVWCSFVSLAALILFKDVKFRLPENITEWSLLASLGVSGFVMQFLLTAGLSYGGPSTSSSSSSNSTTSGAAGGNAKVGDVEARGVGAEVGRAGYTDNSNNKSNAQTRQRESDQSKTKGSGTRATSMVYTQMLFALAGDKLVFGVTPGMWSWVGSGLILAGAVWVAAARDQGKKPSSSSSSLQTSSTPSAGGTVVLAGGDADGSQTEASVHGIASKRKLKVNGADDDDDGGLAEEVVGLMNSPEQQHWDGENAVVLEMDDLGGGAHGESSNSHSHNPSNSISRRSSPVDD